MVTKILTLLLSKVLITVVVAVAIAGGASAAFAATPAGQNVVQSLTQHHPAANEAGDHQSQSGRKGNTSNQNKQGKDCSGMADAQNLAAQFHLSTASTGSAVQAICALHDGSFKGSTPAGAAVSSSRVFGYGEIDQLLTLAQFMASHATANTTATLTDANVSSSLAAALHTCASSPSITDCVKDTISHSHPGDGNGSGNGNGNGKPTTTPTPHH